MPIEFRILGPLEVRAGARLLTLGSPKQAALLGLLLVQADETVSRDRLIEELWGEAPPATVDSAYTSLCRGCDGCSKRPGPAVRWCASGTATGCG
jgi:DNA-binding response OmpR family regulator